MTTKILLPVLFLFCLIAYSSSLSGEFVWDDIPVIVENPYIKDLSYMPRYFKEGVWSVTLIQLKGPPYYRPFFLSSLALDYKIWGLNPFGYRITNLIMHFAIIFFVYLIAEMILKDKTAALIASAFFALHPASTEVVAWIAGRTDMVAGIFLLPAFLLHYKRKYYFSMPLFLFALLSKETSIIFPMLIASYSIVNGKRLFEVLRETAPYLILTVIYFAARGIIFGSDTGALVFTSAKFILIAKAISHYFRFLIFPWPVTFPPTDIAIKISFVDIIGAMAFAGIIITLFKRNKKAVIFSLLWIGFTLLPAFATLFIPSVNNVYYRFLYLPLIGYAIMAGALASSILKDMGKRIKYIVSLILLIILLLYSSIIYVRGFDWRSTVAILEDALKYFPDSAVDHHFLATFLDNDVKKQLYHYQMAAALNPNSADNNIGLGIAYAKLNNYGLAKEYIIKGLNLADISASSSIGYNTLGNIYYLEGKVLEAEEMYRKAIEIDKFMTSAYYNLAAVLKKTGRHEEASAYMKKYETMKALMSDGSK